MRVFQKVEAIEINALQYKRDKIEASRFVRTCVIDHKGAIEPVLDDATPVSKYTFNGVQASTGWKRIDEGDWIVEQNKEILVVPDDLFKYMFSEV